MGVTPKRRGRVGTGPEKLTEVTHKCWYDLIHPDDGSKLWNGVANGPDPASWNKVGVQSFEGVELDRQLMA